jgi:flagellar hook-associated protein 3 FlgL
VVGTRLAWIELTTERRAQVSEQRASEQAQLGGTDIAATITELQHAMTVLEASQASFARLASLSLFDLIR